jgi:hypothetical protein
VGDRIGTILEFTKLGIDFFSGADSFLSSIIFRFFSGLIFLPPVSINGESRQQETDDAESQGKSKDSLLPRIGLSLHIDLI